MTQNAITRFIIAFIAGFPTVLFFHQGLLGLPALAKRLPPDRR